MNNISLGPCKACGAHMLNSEYHGFNKWCLRCSWCGDVQRDENVSESSTHQCDKTDYKWDLYA